jgi:hypothetical protein
MLKGMPHWASSASQKNPRMINKQCSLRINEGYQSQKLLHEQHSKNAAGRFRAVAIDKSAESKHNDQ